MRKRDLVDGLVGPRTREMMDQLLCMNGMTNAEKVDFLMSRNRELRAENEKLRELVRDMYGFIERTDEECGDVTFSDCFDYCKHDATDDGCCKTGECWYEQRMRELGVEVES